MVIEAVDDNSVYNIQKMSLGSTGRVKNSVVPAQIGPNPYLCYA